MNCGLTEGGPNSGCTGLLSWGPSFIGGLSAHCRPWATMSCYPQCLHPQSPPPSHPQCPATCNVSTHSLPHPPPMSCYMQPPIPNVLLPATSPPPMSCYLQHLQPQSPPSTHPQCPATCNLSTPNVLLPATSLPMISTHNVSIFNLSTPSSPPAISQLPMSCKLQHLYQWSQSTTSQSSISPSHPLHLQSPNSQGPATCNISTHDLNPQCLNLQSLHPILSTCNLSTPDVLLPATSLSMISTRNVSILNLSIPSSPPAVSQLPMSCYLQHLYPWCQSTKSQSSISPPHPLHLQSPNSQCPATCNISTHEVNAQCLNLQSLHPTCSLSTQSTSSISKPTTSQPVVSAPSTSPSRVSQPNLQTCNISTRNLTLQPLNLNLSTHTVVTSNSILRWPCMVDRALKSNYQSPTPTISPSTISQPTISQPPKS